MLLVFLVDPFLQLDLRIVTRPIFPVDHTAHRTHWIPGWGIQLLLKFISCCGGRQLEIVNRSWFNRFQECTESGEPGVTVFGCCSG